MRITKAIRKDMLHAIMSKQFYPHAIKLNKELKALITEALQLTYAEQIAAVDLIPEHLRETMLSVTGGARMHVRLIGTIEEDGKEKILNRVSCKFWSSTHRFYTSEMQIPLKYKFGGLCERYEPYFYFDKKLNPELWDKIAAKQEEFDTYAKVMNDAADQITAVLASATTSKKLIELAPEMQSFLPVETAPSRGLISMDTINSVRAMLTPVSK